MHYRALLLDFDGTLAHSTDALHETVNETLRYFGYPPRDRNEIVNKLGSTQPGWYQNVTDDDELVDKMVAHHKTVQFKHLSKYRLYDGVIDTLVKVRQKGIHTVLVTSANKPKMTTLLDSLELRPHIQQMITYDDVSTHKPDPEPFYKALGPLELSPSQAVMVGDSEADIVGAHNAGIDSVGVLFGPIGERICDFKPTYTISTFTDLLAILGVT